MNKQKYHLTECIESWITEWIIEKDAPNSGKVVFKSFDKKEAFKKWRKLNSKNKLYCFIMNLIDFRFWFCDCEYVSPYGLVINHGCEKHD